MKRRCVFWGVVLVTSMQFLFLVSSGNPFAQETTDSGWTSGFLEVAGKDGTYTGSCPLMHTEVKAEISGVLSRVTVRQKFRNSYEAPIEAVYTFPLPHKAAIDDMTVLLGDRKIRGIIKKREEAERIYETARNQGKVAALLDQERPNIFTQKIANIMPGTDVAVTISYTEKLKYSDGGYRFVFPMVVGPRYIPGQPVGRQGDGWSPDTTQVPDASKITPPVAKPETRAGHDISIEVKIESGVPFTNLHSEQHDLVVKRRSPHSATVRLRNRKSIPNKDFILSYDVAGNSIQDAVLTHKAAEDGYFMLLLQPPLDVHPDQIVPKELVFVLDTSGSMQGFPIEKAKETMLLALDGLYPEDTFNLITFSGDTHILFPRPVAATQENLRHAKNFLSSRRGGGGTEMMKAIRAALAPSDALEHVRIVCFMTDGFVGNDMQIISEVQKHPNARVFSFGIGSSPNRFLLDRMAEEGRGAAEYVTLQSDAEEAAIRFHERIRNPLLTDISLEWDGVQVTDLYPKRIPDLFSAEPVTVCGRYAKGGNAVVKLKGITGKGVFIRDIQLDLPDSDTRNEAIGKLWARNRIASLMALDYEGMQRGNPLGEVKDKITQLGLKYRLMTQFTSFVAVEEKIRNEDGKRIKVQVPVEIPEGTSYEGVFGSSDKRAMRGGGVGYGYGGGIGVGAGAGVAGYAGGVVGGIPGGVAGGIPGGVLSMPTVIPSQVPSPPPPARADRQPMAVGGNVLNSRLVRRVEPVYPELARSARLSGLVLLVITVDEEGNVSGARVVRGQPLLNESAIAAVKQWKYSPTLLNGSPVPVTATVTVAFKLSDAAIKENSEPRIDSALAEVLSRINAGQTVDHMPFVREGKAEIRITVTERSDTVLDKIKSKGFEISSLAEDPGMVNGRIDVQKLGSLLDIEEVVFITALDK